MQIIKKIAVMTIVFQNIQINVLTQNRENQKETKVVNKNQITKQNINIQQDQKNQPA